MRLIEKFPPRSIVDRKAIIVSGAASLENSEVGGCEGVGPLHGSGLLSVTIVISVGDISRVQRNSLSAVHPR